jgi:hypothetical protein
MSAQPVQYPTMAQPRGPKRNQLFILKHHGQVVRFKGWADLKILASGGDEVRRFGVRCHNEGLSSEGAVALVEVLPEGAGRHAKGDVMLINEHELGREMAPDNQPQVVD